MVKHIKKKNNRKIGNNNEDKKNNDFANIDINKKFVDKLFWIRVCMASIGGLMATLLFEPVEGEERRWLSILLLLVIFIISIIIAKLFKIQFPKSEQKKLITTGIGSYVFIYLFVWILTYTLLHVKT
ncbi:MAG: hypothetical protein OXF28_02130 [Thaumarchaeota archaeon]|nr:hypothetical protein [Nitrososphaerota archaeon]MCY3975915.1 hypothetical protein [Nitrososphaerota archaeon]